MEPCGVIEGIGAILIGTYIAIQDGPQITQAAKDVAKATGSVIDCYNQYLKDLGVCAEAYPPGPKRDQCYAKAKAKLDFCRNKTSGLVQ